jgi:hypothetical protein
MAADEPRIPYLSKQSEDKYISAGGKATPTSPSPSGDNKTKTKGGSTTPKGTVKPATLPESFESSPEVAPIESEIGGLASSYNNIMGQIDAIPGGSTTSPTGPNATINADVAAANAAQAKTTQNLQGSELGMAKALGGMKGAAATQAEDLPYADVFSTLLTQKKNELLYGTQPTFAPTEKGWSKDLKGIYDYIAAEKPVKGATGGPGSTNLQDISALIGGNPANPAGT